MKDAGQAAPSQGACQPSPFELLSLRRPGTATYGKPTADFRLNIFAELQSKLDSLLATAK